MWSSPPGEICRIQEIFGHQPLALFWCHSSLVSKTIPATLAKGSTDCSALILAIS